MDGGYLWWFPGMNDGSYGLPTQDGKSLFWPRDYPDG